MKGRAGIITVLMITFLTTALTLLWPWIDTFTPSRDPAPGTPAQTTTGPEPPPVSPTQVSPTQVSPTSEDSSPPSPDLATTPPVDHATVGRFVNAFATAFARPDPGKGDAWLLDVAGYLDPDMQRAVDTIGPHLVPYHTVTGPPIVEGKSWPYTATVPTDAGPLTVTVCPDTTGEPGIDQRMTICGIDLGGHP